MDESYKQAWKTFLVETDYQKELNSPSEIARHKRNRLSTKGNVTKGSAPFTEEPPSERSKSAPPMAEGDMEEDILFKPLDKQQKAHASKLIRIKYKDKPLDKDGIIDPKVAKDEKEEQLYEKKDRCYNIAKRKYKAFPSAYASGAIVKCRQGKIWKKKSTNEQQLDEALNLQALKGYFEKIKQKIPNLNVIGLIAKAPQIFAVIKDLRAVFSQTNELKGGKPRKPFLLPLINKYGVAIAGLGLAVSALMNGSAPPEFSFDMIMNKGTVGDFVEKIVDLNPEIITGLHQTVAGGAGLI